MAAMPDSMKVALLAGLLSFLGAVGGTFVSSALEESRNTRKQQVEGRTKIVEKRLDVIEKCATARSLVGRARTLLQFQDLEQRRLSKLPKDAIEEQAPKLYSLEMQKEFAAIQTMHLACVDMGSLIFGPKSRAAALAVFKNPSRWIPDEKNEKLNDFYDALVAEVQYFDRPSKKD